MFYITSHCIGTCKIDIEHSNRYNNKFDLNLSEDYVFDVHILVPRKENERET